MDHTKTKICRKCNVAKALTEFQKKCKAGGFKHHCKACARILRSGYNAKYRRKLVGKFDEAFYERTANVPKVCSTCGCEKASSEFAKDLRVNCGYTARCKQCVLDIRRERYSLSTDGEKLCNTCGQSKPVHEYSRAPGNVDGRTKKCKACHSVYSRERHRKVAYGLTADEYDTMLESQGGACAACGSDERLVVDHCHDTNQVRGILCSNCNTAIGLLGHSLERVEQAGEYLKSRGVTSYDISDSAVRAR